MVLEKRVNMIFELGPTDPLASNHSASNFSQSISDVLLHCKVFLLVDYLKELDFDGFLSLFGNAVPKVLVSRRTEIREIESELRG